MKSEVRDRLENLQADIVTILEKDAQLVLFMHRASEADPSTLETLLLLPTESFPVVRDGIEWKNKKQVRIATWAQLSKKNWPAWMQAAHERLSLLVRGLDQAQAGGTVGINLQIVAIPATQQAALTAPVVRMRRDDHGKLTTVETAPVARLPAAQVAPPIDVHSKSNTG